MIYLLVPTLAAASLLAMAAFPGHATPLGDDPLAAYRGKARVLVVVAPDAADAQLVEQRSLFTSMKRQADERDLALVEGIGNDARAGALRKALGLGDQGFYAVLVGKDGGGKLTARAPLGRDQLLPLIDAMPMRQQEMQNK